MSAARKSSRPKRVEPKSQLRLRAMRTVKLEVQEALNDAKNAPDLATANQAYAAGFDAHTGVPGSGAVMSETHRLYVKMPPHWVMYAFSALGQTLASKPENRSDLEKRLQHRDAPHWVAGLAWGLAHRDTVEGLVSAAFLIDHLMGGKNKPEALKRERDKISEYYSPVPRERFALRDVFQRFRARPLPSDELAAETERKLREGGAK